MKDLIRRNTPEIAERFLLETVDAVDGYNVLEYASQGEKIVLRGDCMISQAMAYYRYLKQECHVNWSHCANERIHVTEAVLPENDYRQVVPQKKRAYLNYCTFGYSMAWWDWERWEREIDFMAMQGINMPLSVVGTEASWFYTLRELGYKDDEALTYLSGPAFWPWQLMTNIDYYLPLTDEAFIKERVALGKQILQRQLHLGMTPIQQGYCGQVPRDFLRRYSKTMLRRIPSWCNFPPTFQIDPTDPMFQKVGGIFLEKQRQLFGAHHYYACDPFHENEPPVKGKRQKAYLAGVAKAIGRMYRHFDQQSVWVMQSWSLREDIVRTIPKGELLVLDIDGSKYQKTEGFWGHDFILGTIHNFGDRTSLHGSIAEMAANKFLPAKAEYQNAIGTGLFPEGIMQNPLYYDLAFEMLCQDKAIDLDGWLDDYARRRYGSDEGCLRDAVHSLRESCYSDACTDRETGSILCARPTLDWVHTSTNDTNALRYDNRILLQAATQLLQAKDATSDGYYYDVCDITRQVISNYARTLYHRTIIGYQEKNLALFEENSNAFLTLFGELDELLSTRPELNMAQQLQAPSKLATNDIDKQNYEINALALVTVWGPIQNAVNYDYAWKEWAGLLNSYYLPRWRLLFEKLALAFPQKKLISTNTKTRPNGRDTYQGSSYHKQLAKIETDFLGKYLPGKEIPDGNTLEVATRLLDQYRDSILSIEVDPIQTVDMQGPATWDMA